MVQEPEPVDGQLTIDDWLDRVHKLRASSQSRVRTEDILHARHADLR